MKNLLIFFIRLYQKHLSPLKKMRCPYYPTCSHYGIEAIEKHGALKGSMLAIWRVLRCNPFHMEESTRFRMNFCLFTGGKKIEKNVTYKK